MSTDERTVEQSTHGEAFQDAHHFSTGGNVRVMNIGRSYGLDEFVSFSALHDSSAQDPERRCHPGTRNGILNQIHNWADDPSRPERILWLHGPAGAGKSAIAQTISRSYDRDKVGATFFFFRSDPIRNDGKRLFPTLAWQLASSVPIVKDLIASSWEENPDLHTKTIEVQFEQLIAQPFLAISGDESTAQTSMRIIIIDGLDECSDDKLQRRILKIIGNAVTDTRIPLRFIISSRPDLHIEDFFDQYQYPTLQIDLANVDDVYRDIETYLTSEFARIAVLRGFDPTWPGQEIVRDLVIKSSGYYIYASIVIRLISDEDNDPLAQLDIILGLKPPHTVSPFAELDELYTKILERQPDQNLLTTFLGLLVGHYSISQHSLNNDDIILMGISRVELDRKLRQMRSILNFEPYIDVHHKSFLDFLQDPLRSSQYYVSKSAGTRRYVELMTNLLSDHATKLTRQPDFHSIDHFAPRFGKLINCNPQAIELNAEDWEQILRPLLNILDKLLEPSNLDSLMDGYCQQCQFFQITFNTLTHFKSLRESPDVEKCLNSLEEIILYGDHAQQDFDMNFRRIVFGSVAVIGSLMAILAHRR